MSGCGSSEASRTAQSELDQPVQPNTVINAPTITGGLNHTVTAGEDDVCDKSGSRGIYLRTGAPIYRPGDQLEVTIVDESVDSVFYGLCYPALERCETEGWTDTKAYLGPPDIPPENLGCTTVGYGMGPGGQSPPMRVHLPDDLPSGSYRFTYSVEIGPGYVQSDQDLQAIWSDAFEVVED
jgi:hypothetical protein